MSVITFLDAVTSTGASSIKQLPFLVSDHVVQVTITGAPDAVTVNVEGSLDGVTFYAVGGHDFSASELTAAVAMFHVSGVPVNYVRLNLVTLEGGTTPTVTAKYDGDSLSTGIRHTGRRGQF